MAADGQADVLVIFGITGDLAAYRQNEWGPKSSDRLVADLGGWHDPWLADDGQQTPNTSKDTR